MNQIQILSACLASFVLVGIVFNHTGWKNIRDCFAMWLDRSYWTSYNIVEAASWSAKAAIIVPGLIFGIQLWWLYFFTLATSLTLIWASNKKLLPSLVAFNAIWTWLSCMVLAQHLV
jgi:hypothetical protein